MSLLSWFGLKTPDPSAPQNTWSLTNTAFPASPRSPSRPLSRMGCGGDYRFQSRGRTTVGSTTGRTPHGVTCRVFLCPIVGLFWGVPACSWVGRQKVWANVKKYGLASKGSIYQDCQGQPIECAAVANFFGFCYAGWLGTSPSTEHGWKPSI